MIRVERFNYDNWDWAISVSEDRPSRYKGIEDVEVKCKMDDGHDSACRRYYYAAGLRYCPLVVLD